MKYLLTIIFVSIIYSTSFAQIDTSISNDELEFISSSSVKPNLHNYTFVDHSNNDLNASLLKASSSIAPKKVKESLEVIVFPNIASDFIHVNTSQEINPANIKILKAEGEALAIKAKSSINNTTRFDISQLPTGNYIISIEGNNEVIRKSFFVQ